MLNNLPVGIYIPGQTPLHRLRARTKLLVLIWLALLLFLANHRVFHFGAYVAAFSLLAIGLLLARIHPYYIWRRMRLLVLLLLIGIPFSLMFTPGATWHTLGPIQVHFNQIAGFQDVSLSLGPVVVTYDGIWFVISFGAIFLLLYLGSLTLTLTTTPVALAEGIMLLLRPLRRVGLPVEEFGLMTLVSLRFIPVLIQEAEQLMKAQISRGADFTTGSIGVRIRRLGTLLVPLVQGALRRADNLSSALEARGYGTTGQATLLHEGPLRAADWIVLVGVPLVTTLAYWKLL
jgi:energy-coupling factor transport system permease protein